MENKGKINVLRKDNKIDVTFENMFAIDVVGALKILISSIAGEENVYPIMIDILNKGKVNPKSGIDHSIYKTLIDWMTDAEKERKINEEFRNAPINNDTLMN